MTNRRHKPAGGGVRVAFLDSEEAEWKYFREDRCEGCKKAKLHECTQPEDADGERRRGCYGCTTLANKPIPCSLVDAPESRSPSPLSEDEWTRKRVAKEEYTHRKNEAANYAAKENKYATSAARAIPVKHQTYNPASRPTTSRGMQNLSTSYPPRRTSGGGGGSSNNAEDVHQLRAIVIARERRLETAQAMLDGLMREVERAREEVARRSEELNEARVELAMEERARR